MTLGILTDVTKCIGCNRCVQACQISNKLAPEKPWPWLEHIDDLSSARWTNLTQVRKEKMTRYVRHQCRHCTDPECVSVCIVGALKKTPEGPVIYDKDICIGCRYCMIACPWEIPRYSWEDTMPYVQKCDFCYERVVKKGGKPACVEACPTGATIFGERDELLAEARRRIKASPGKYIDRIWGEKQVGGTNVLYISDVDLNLTELDHGVAESEASMPHRTTKILHQMPAVFVGMATVMGGLTWFINRKQEIAEATAREAADKEAAGAEPSEDEATSDDSKAKDAKGEE